MTVLKALALSCGMVLTSLSALSANLILNPGNEDALVGGEIQGWTEVVGSNWTQRSTDPTAYEGTYYFFAGAGAHATLRQAIDVSAFAAQIDAGMLKFDFSGRVRSWPQTPTDTATIILSFLDSTSNVLGSFDSGPIANHSEWQLVATVLEAPSLTRSVQIDLISTRHAGTNNDGYFDDLNLAAVPVPEPSALAMMMAGLALVLFSSRPRRR